MTTVALADVVAWLDDYLRIRDVPDEAPALNGLQVENRGRVARVVAAVDACQASIDAAAHGDGPALLLVHHGLFWDGNLPLTGRRGRRVRGLYDHNTALYSAHIPLDLHAEVGNNAVLAAKLGMTIDGAWGQYRGTMIGVHGTLDCTVPELRDRLSDVLGGATVTVLPGGPERIRRVGIITGGAGRSIAEAAALGLDAFITGEGAHHTYFDASEGGITAFYAGHYATETVGVQALAAKLEQQFGLPWSFHHHPTGL